LDHFYPGLFTETYTGAKKARLPEKKLAYCHLADHTGNTHIQDIQKSKIDERLAQCATNKSGIIC